MDNLDEILKDLEFHAESLTQKGDHCAVQSVDTQKSEFTI